MEALKASILLVIKNEPMPEEYLLHRLKGNKYPDYLEFHVGRLPLHIHAGRGNRHGNIRPLRYSF